MKRLDEGVAIVTGAASGIGKATARLFAEAGAKVVALDRDGERSCAVVAEIVASGRTAQQRAPEGQVER